MYIAPNTIARVLKNVRLDNTYSDTIYFDSKEKQTAYFAGKTKYTFTNMTYQRKERRLVVKQVADNMFDCNYLMFQNSSYGNKWFYAFITNVEWLNNETAAIYFEIDDMQTWFFDFYLDTSFVEREHSATDSVGDNLIEDNLDTGEYVHDDFIESFVGSKYNYVVAATVDKDYEPNTGGIYSGIYSGVELNVFENASGASTYLANLPDTLTDAVIALYMMPEAFTNTKNTTTPKTFNASVDKKVSNVWKTFTPHNNKIYTYPYNFLYVTNLDGIGVSFPYEYFSSEKCTFQISGDMSCNPQVVMFPLNYKGIEKNYNEKIALENFPMCAYSVDTYKAWLAQSAVPSLGQAGISATVQASTGNEAGAGVTMLSSIANILVQNAARKHDPYTIKGHAGNGASVALGIKNFYYSHTHVREEFARIIDSFWDKFGYPVRRVKIPSTHNRPHWNYVKTVGCDAHGSIPSSAMSNIKAIHDKGITYWINGDEIGNYLLDNRLKGSS